MSARRHATASPVVVCGLAFLMMLAGCGGGSDAPAPTVQTAYLVGGLIENLPYACGGQKGRTTRIGEFQYVPGDYCVFNVGKLSLPVAADKLRKGYVTAYDLTATREEAWTLMAIIDSISVRRQHSDLFVVVDGALEQRIPWVRLKDGDAAVTAALTTFAGTVE